MIYTQPLKVGGWGVTGRDREFKIQSDSGPWKGSSLASASLARD